jgi:hypothetical protein
VEPVVFLVFHRETEGATRRIVAIEHHDPVG